MSHAEVARPVRAVASPGPEDARRLLFPVLEHAIAELGGGLAHVCGFQLGLLDVDGHRTRTVGGKLLRPRLMLLCAAAAGAGTREVAVPAAAVELLHNASLIHDDIMDGDTVRRHRPTVWAHFGVPMAILAGDALIALGFELLSASTHRSTGPATRSLARSLRRLASGQYDDLRFEHLDRIPLDSCLAMMARKTGELIGLACRLGAIYADTPTEWVDRFTSFGTRLGVAFQLADDLLGIWGDPMITGKPVGSDLRARKKSGPVTWTLHSDDPAAERLSRLYQQDGPLSDEAAATAAALIQRAGGAVWARTEMRRQVAAAWRHVEGLDLRPAARRDLEALTTALLRRVEHIAAT